MILNFNVSTVVVFFTFVCFIRSLNVNHINDNINGAIDDEIGENIVLVTRIHTRNSSKLPNILDVQIFINYGLRFSKYIIICICINEDGNFKSEIQNLSKLIEYNNRVVILEVSPWGKFVTALNVAILHAVQLRAKFICFQSLEFEISLKDVRSLLRHFEEGTIVVGPSMPGHHFSEGRNKIRGRTCPWNTFAIWRLNDLYKVGFLPISDGVIRDPDSGGVEEVVTINLLLNLFPHCTAKLVKLNNIIWHTNFSDESRRIYHNKKMESKDARPAAQIDELGIKETEIIHVIDN